MTTSGVFVDERGDVVNETSDEDKRASLGLFLEAIPADDGKVVRVGGPFEISTNLLQLLEFHGELTLLDFVVGEALEVASKTDPAANANEPLGRIVLVPFDSIAIIGGELVMEIVVSFTDGNKCGQDVVARRVLIVEWSITEIMREGVDAEC
jgi:hypothetical protein